MERFKLATESHSRNKIISFGNIIIEEVYSNNFMWSRLHSSESCGAGIVEKASHYVYSSASNYVPIQDY
jgi:hypothetical protein